jgi:hypothetical protein
MICGLFLRNLREPFYLEQHRAGRKLSFIVISAGWRIIHGHSSILLSFSFCLLSLNSKELRAKGREEAGRLVFYLFPFIFYL